METVDGICKVGGSGCSLSNASARQKVLSGIELYRIPDPKKGGESLVKEDEGEAGGVGGSLQHQRHNQSREGNEKPNVFVFGFFACYLSLSNFH